MPQEVTKTDLANLVNLIELSWRNGLTDGVSSPDHIAITRRQWELMADDWTNRQDRVYKLYGGPCLSTTARLEAWEKSAHNVARREVAYETVVPERYFRKGEEYGNYIDGVKVRFTQFFDWYKNKFTGVTVLLEPHNCTKPLMDILASEFMRWFDEQLVTEALLLRAPVVGLADFLTQRQDMKELLQVVHALPLQRSEIQGDVEVPFAVEAIEFGISLIPFLGNAVAAYEASVGENLFGYKLTTLERAVIAAAVVLPIAGRLFKNGRLLYSEARLAKLYGRTPGYWGRVIKSAARAEEQKEASRIVQKAEKLIRGKQKLATVVVQEVTEAMPKLLKSEGKILVPIEKEVEALWSTLSKKYKVLESLDEHALRRVLAKGAVASHIQGQLLEEIAASHIVPWLGTRQGAYALGIKVPKGAKLEYLPGHLLATVSKGKKRSLQITDGLLGYYQDGVFHIGGIFEVKSGKQGARELSFAKESLKDLSKAEKKELRAVAKGVYANELNVATKKGEKYTTTIEEIEESLLTEERGQIQRDFERLDELADGTLERIYIGTEMKPVKLIRGTKTKVFAILPKRSHLKSLEKTLAAQNFNVEALAAPITRKDLDGITKELLPLAEKMLEQPPGL